LGEGSGALTALPLIQASVALHNQMATFEQADVPDKAD
jgi:nicotinate-nucleotide--dimethylbenzimidazole phosphoribosyltransferase